MKDLGNTTFCIGIQLAYITGGVIFHQTTYVKKMLEKFQMDKSHPVSTPMVVRTLDIKNDPLAPRKEGEKAMDQSSVSYLSAIGSLMYLANCTRPDISFAVNLLARFSQDPTERHWTGIKQIFRYLSGTQDLGLYFANHNQNRNDLSGYIKDFPNIGQNEEPIVGYADAGYNSDPHKSKSQTGYVFIYNGTAISWKSTKQTITATSSNHSEIIALHEASRECIWLRRLINHFQSKSGYSLIEKPTVIFEDNAACVRQFKEGFIKGDRTKHIDPKFFFTAELEGKEINIQSIASSNNVADILTKSLGKNLHWNHVKTLGL